MTSRWTRARLKVRSRLRRKAAANERRATAVAAHVRDRRAVRPFPDRGRGERARSFGPSAIYSINWCDEASASAAAFGIKHEPLNPYSVKKALDSMEQLQPRIAGPVADEGDFE
jgi:hypothetical protein